MLSAVVKRLAHVVLAWVLVTCGCACGGRHVFSVQGDKTYLNGEPFLVIGLRCSNALISDATADALIGQLDSYASYGVNTVSVYFMGSRFGDVKGYREDGALDPVYAGRMGRIIQAADVRGMVVLVGCLYWSTSTAKWDSWEQAQAEAAVVNTVRWLKEHDYRNVFVDVDNEGMARGEEVRQPADGDCRQGGRPAVRHCDELPGPLPCRGGPRDSPQRAACGQAVHRERSDAGECAGRVLGRLQQKGRVLQLHQHRPVYRGDEGGPDSSDGCTSGSGGWVHVGVDVAAVRGAVWTECPARRVRRQGRSGNTLVA